MDVYEAIEKRYSVRSYQDRFIEDDKLERVLAVARDAPTARNRQQWKLVIVTDPRTRQELAEAADQPFLAQAPVILAMIGLTPEEMMYCQVPTDPVDCAIVLEHVALAAVAEELGTCWIGHFDQKACRKVLSVPASAWVIELMPIGYPAADQPPRKRKTLAELTCRDKFC